MATDPDIPVPNPVQDRDAEVLIGILAVLEGVIWNGSLDADHEQDRGTIRTAGLAGCRSRSA